MNLLDKIAALDRREVKRLLAEELTRQGEALGSIARAAMADMERMKAAVRSPGSRT